MNTMPYVVQDKCLTICNYYINLVDAIQASKRLSFTKNKTIYVYRCSDNQLLATTAPGKAQYR